jgi:hypothetical protein
MDQVPHCDNTAVTVLEADGSSIRIAEMGDNSHLSDEISTFAQQRWWREAIQAGQ